MVSEHYNDWVRGLGEGQVYQVCTSSDHLHQARKARPLHYWPVRAFQTGPGRHGLGPNQARRLSSKPGDSDWVDPGEDGGLYSMATCPWTGGGMAEL